MDGNKNEIDGMINISKRSTQVQFTNVTFIELMHQAISTIEQYQHMPYKFPVVEPLHTFLEELPSLVDSDLYELSLQRESQQDTEAVAISKANEISSSRWSLFSSKRH